MKFDILFFVSEQYKFDPETGEWRHSQHQVFHDRKWLGHVTYRTGSMQYTQPGFTARGPLPNDNMVSCTSTVTRPLVNVHLCFVGYYKL